MTDQREAGFDFARRFRSVRRHRACAQMKHASTFLVLSLVMISCSTMPARKPVQPPVAKKIPKVDVLHGDRRVDDYFWLREKTNPAVMKPTEKFQGALYKEMLAHIKETDFSVPVRYRGWWYYSRTEKGKQYPIHQA